jgi:hypothetical protein
MNLIDGNIESKRMQHFLLLQLEELLEWVHMIESAARCLSLANQEIMEILHGDRTEMGTLPQVFVTTMDTMAIGQARAGHMMIDYLQDLMAEVLVVRLDLQNDVLLGLEEATRTQSGHSQFLEAQASAVLVGLVEGIKALVAE